MTQYLSKQAIKKRKRNSAISISCEMSMHALELLFELILLLSKDISTWNLIWSVYQFEFAVKSVCQALNSEARRKWLLELIRRLRRSNLCYNSTIAPTTG